MNLPKSKFIVVDDKNLVTAVIPSSLLPVGNAFLLDIAFTIKPGDIYDGVVVTPDPDAAKKAALQLEADKAAQALQAAPDDKASILKVLSDATIAVNALP